MLMQVTVLRVKISKVSDNSISENVPGISSRLSVYKPIATEISYVE